MNKTFLWSKVLAFTQDITSKSLSFAHMIVDSTHPIPELNPSFSDGVFLNGWFGIPFQNNLSFTHISSPHPSEMLILYILTNLIPFYPTILSST